MSIELIKNKILNQVGNDALMYIEKLEQELRLEKEVVDFYADQKNYNDSNYHNEFELTEDMYSEGYCQFSAGKKARQRQKERKDL